MARHVSLLCLLFAARLHLSVDAHPNVDSKGMSHFLEIASASKNDEKVQTFNEVASDGKECALLRKVKNTLKPFSHNGTVRYPVLPFFQDPKNLLVQTNSSGYSDFDVEYVNFTKISGVSDSSLIVMDVRTLGDNCNQVYMHLYLNVKRLALEGNYTNIDSLNGNETRSGHFKWKPLFDVGFTSGVKITLVDVTTTFFYMDGDWGRESSDGNRYDDSFQVGGSIVEQIREQFALLFRHFVDEVATRMATEEDGRRNLEAGEERGAEETTERRDPPEEDHSEKTLPRLTLSDRVKIVLQRFSKNGTVTLPSHSFESDKTIPTYLHSSDSDSYRRRGYEGVLCYTAFSGLADSVVNVIHVGDPIGYPPKVRMHVFVAAPSLSVRGNCTLTPYKKTCDGVPDCSPKTWELGGLRVPDFGALAVVTIYTIPAQVGILGPTVYRGDGSKIPAKNWRGEDEDLAWVLDEPLRELISNFAFQFTESLKREMRKLTR